MDRCLSGLFAQLLYFVGQVLVRLYVRLQLHLNAWKSVGLYKAAYWWSNNLNNNSTQTHIEFEMSAYKSFAVVGAGTVGLPIVNALAARNVSVVLLSRPGSTKAVPSGVQVAQVDYNNAAAVAAVFKQYKVDVVLSTITTMATDAQKSLVDASKLAAVKLFVPSEYGMPTDGQAEGILGLKDQIAGKNIHCDTYLPFKAHKLPTNSLLEIRQHSFP
jgi:hypothetical protein